MTTVIPVHVKSDGTKEVKHRGFLVTLVDRSFVVPPLSLGQIREFKDLIAQQRDTTQSKYDQMIASLPMLLASLRRNYPELTEDTLLDIIDLESWPEVVNAVFNVSGLLAKMKATEEGEAKQSVE